MANLEYKRSYSRNLPHIQPEGAILFVTYRLVGSLPAHIVRQLKAETNRPHREIEPSTATGSQDIMFLGEHRHNFGRFDSELDQANYGPAWFRRPEIAQLVMDSLHYLDGRKIELDVYCVMSNHVHAVFAPLEDRDGYVSLARIMHSHKRHTARQANKILCRSGHFWQHESYDHIVRNENELNLIRQYVLNNPVKVGLVDEPEKWPYSWARWW